MTRFDGRTESYDSMKPVGEDPRWEVFGPFHEYLLSAFLLVYVLFSICCVFEPYTNNINCLSTP